MVWMRGSVGAEEEDEGSEEGGGRWKEGMSQIQPREEVS